MENEHGQIVDLYIPRKCSATGRLIKAKDHASIQINVGHVDEATGVLNGECTTYAISGPPRSFAESDSSLNRLAQNDGLLENVFEYSQ
ncbi:hypothetical protein CXG81DRAFT_11658 [Caulochytrium protostelioides]|uniref:40S ribosomal protein S21 n=1 Tax=Caulochytrium protostelioides TaxID=1555241 RepID=A0A4P9X9J9_9FUNG|nr:hypothetical protein CXG81DRAFT_11658 [Caulochytrium protostelioides]|eukprot:RKP01691.1 hypothetical protein CXG81DRAFT_11658 [Caulochytrium protostelioides]